MIVTTKKLFELAYGKYALGAYNINNAEQTMGLFRGCVDSQAPFIIQISKGARTYTNKVMLEGIIRAADEIFPEAVFAVHLDHGDEKTCMDCIESGFYSSVMIDASHEPYEKNIEITRRVVDAAHARGLVVEAELGQLGGVEEHVSVSEADAKLTDPEQAKDFVTRSQVDSLACAIGTSHGAFKFSGTQGLRFDVLAQIQQRLPDFPLVMHGSSSVPQEEVARINAAGGAAQGRQGRGRQSVQARGGTRRDQNQHRHRWSPGVDARPPRVFPRLSGEVRPARSRQDLHRRVRQVHRIQEREARQCRPDPGHPRGAGVNRIETAKRTADFADVRR